MSASESRRPAAYARWVTWGAIVIVALACLTAIVLFTVNRPASLPQSWGAGGGPRFGILYWLNVLLFSVQSLLSVIIGALVISRNPRDRIGWLILLAGIGGGLLLLLEELVVFTAFTMGWESPSVRLLSWLKNWIWAPYNTLIMLTLALFPTGHFLSRRWSLIVGLPLGLLTGLAMFAMLIQSPMSSSFQLPNPYFDAGSELLPAALYGSVRLLILLTLPAILAQMVARYRAGGFIERQQIKWSVIGIAAMLAMAIAGYIVQLSTGALLARILANSATIFPLLGLSFGMLRYRLYDVDLIIRRTVVYGLLTGALAVIYFGSVIVMQAVTQRVTGQAGDSPLIIVASTLLIAALFTPLRRRLQNGIDRRFYRPKYDAQKALAAFAQTARDEVELEALTAEMFRVVQETLQPECAFLWLREERPA